MESHREELGRSCYCGRALSDLSGLGGSHFRPPLRQEDFQRTQVLAADLQRAYGAFLPLAGLCRLPTVYSLKALSQDEAKSVAAKAIRAGCAMS